MKQFLFLFIATALLFTACKKEQGESIDYNKLTEERILGVSEQDAITDQDIAPLERLISNNITDPATKTRLTEMLNSVKLLKDILPMMTQLRTDENINFPEKYAEVHKMASQLSELIPRKAEVLKELENNKDGYDNEEVRFSEDHSEFFKQEYNIDPIPGKDYVAFRRSDIDKVDSIGFMSYIDIKKFTNLKIIDQSYNTDEEGSEDGIVNLNKFNRLEKLTISIKEGNQLVFDSCKNLKEITINGASALQRLDLTNSLDSLRILNLHNTESLKSLILPDKKFLTEVVIKSDWEAKPAELDTLIVSGNGKTSVSYTGIKHEEVRLVRLANVGDIEIAGGRFIKTGESESGYDLGYSATTRIRNLEITNATGLSLRILNLSEAVDLSSFENLTSLYIYSCAADAASDTIYNMTSKDIIGLENAKALESLTIWHINLEEDFITVLKNLNNLVYINFGDKVVWPRNSILDFRNLKKLTTATLESGPPEGETKSRIKKIILWKGVKNNTDEVGNTFTLYPDETMTEIEYVD